MAQNFDTPVLVSSSGVNLYACEHVNIICQQDANILVANSYRHPYLGPRTSVDMPDFETMLFTITNVCGNDFEIFPHNFIAGLAYIFIQG